jgi:hypothetical protein
MASISSRAEDLKCGEDLECCSCGASPRVPYAASGAAPLRTSDQLRESSGGQNKELQQKRIGWPRQVAFERHPSFGRITSSRWVCWTRTSIHRERAEQLRQATSARHPSARRITSSCWRYWARTGVYQERIGWLRQVAFSWRAFRSANWQTPQTSRMRSTSRIASLQRSASMSRRRGSIDGQ